MVAGDGLDGFSEKSAVTQDTGFITLSAVAVNACDAGPLRYFLATVNALPAAPVITATGPTLTASSADGNQGIKHR